MSMKENLCTQLEFNMGPEDSELLSNQRKTVASKKIFDRIREIVAKTEAKPSAWKERELPSSEWSIYADMKRFEVVG